MVGLKAFATMGLVALAAVAANGAGHGKKEGGSHAAPVRKAAAAHAVDAGDHGSAPAAAHATGHAVHWGYDGFDGPEHWGHLDAGYRLCGTGQSQSPIDLGMANTVASVMVQTDYKRGPLTVLNNGHTVQVNFDGAAGLMSSNHRYSLKQVHFHTPSEHVINGRRYPLEAHFVHADEYGKLAVLGVLFEEGPTNLELAKVIVAAPRRESAPKTVEGFSFDPRALLPASLEVYRYMGSLTTPPCSEGVNWHVAAQPITASASQMADLMEIMGNNARPVQAFNERLLIAAR